MKKILFRLYLTALFSFVSFSYYAYGLDTNTRLLLTSDPSSICSNFNGGTLDPTFTITDEEYKSSFLDGYTYIYFKTFYQNAPEFNSKQLPYLLESIAETTTTARLIYDFIDHGNGDYTVKEKLFKCSCPSGIWDDYGMCKPNPSYNSDKPSSWTSASQVCSYGGDIKNANGVFGPDTTSTNNYGPNKTTLDAFGKTWVRDSTNQGNFPTVYSKYNTNFSGGKAVYVYGYSQRDNDPIHAEETFFINYKTIECVCPDSNPKDRWGICQPTDCVPPLVEDFISGQCVQPQICADGGLQHPTKLCDRTCEEVGMFTRNEGIDLYNPEAILKKCIPKLDCYDFSNYCISKCGSKDNINLDTFNCNSETGITNCQCRDDNLDNQVKDPDQIDENSTDSEISNSLLKSIKDENLKQTAHIEEMSSLLYQSNENDLKRETQLNSIDGKLSNIDNSIGHLHDGLTNLNNDINTNAQETNSWLQDILNKIDEFYNFFFDGSEQLGSLTNSTMDSIQSSIENGDKISDLDLEGQTQSFLDNAVSKYQNSLGFSSSYGARPSNITVTLYGEDYTMLDFSLLDNHIDSIRNLFLVMAYLTGFIILLKKD